MKFYNYSRESAINLAIQRYKEYLEMVVAKKEYDETLDKVCTYHLFFRQFFPEELNEKIRYIISNVDKKCKRLEVGIKSQSTERKQDLVEKKLDISKGIKTMELLDTVLLVLTCNVANEHYVKLDICLKGFMRRFEVIGKLHEEYTENFKQNLGSYSVIHNYVLLAVNLLINDGFKNNLKILNAVLKLNDLLEILIDKIKSPELFPLLLYSFIAEQEKIKRLYDSKGFRLSAD